ncbi:MAG TPA: putative toxin-antitoxin system toxin component, PIN family [Pirellulales bacterium]|nr:putative toxin-antitoxin system toxin component, PIN family [Pirellulales bacterium]
MRVVLDTNILVRAVSSPHGPAGELFDRLLVGHLLISSAQLLSELARTLAYQRVRTLHGLDDEGVNRFVDKVQSGSLVVSIPEPIPRVVPADLDDDVVIAAAIAGAADVICTRNKHLRHSDVIAYCAARSVRVLDDIELLGKLRSQGGAS